MISYAQNFEDVILSRALKSVEKGAYVDIGANDPVVDSVSLAFYERGWRGVHVEPMPSYAAALRAARPDETVIEAAVTSAKGPIVLSAFEGTGLTTGVEEHARRHETAGRQAAPLAARAVTLAAVLEPFADRDLHWLKIDVEGMEADVLESWGNSPVRPWIVVVESTLPLTTKQSHEAWERLLFARGYAEVYFDGLNRFYLHDAHADLAAAFGPGPNYFDGFSLTEGSPFTVPIRNAIRAIRAEADDASRSLADVRGMLDRQTAGIGAAVAAAVEAVRAEASDARIRLDARVGEAEAARDVALAQTAQLSERLADRDAEIARLSSALEGEASLRANHDAEAAALRAELAAERIRNDADLAAAKLAIANAERLRAEGLQDAEARAARLSRDAAQWRETAHAYRNQTEALRASLSWRLSAPVRWAGMGVRGVAAGLKGALRPVAESTLGLVRANPWMKTPILVAANLAPPIRRKLDHFSVVRRAAEIDDQPKFVDIGSNRPPHAASSRPIRPLRPRAAAVYKDLTAL